jgi:hypothetical protein
MLSRLRPQPTDADTVRAEGYGRRDRFAHGAIETSQKAAKGIHINDLAAWMDARVAAARKENDQLYWRR